MVSTYKETSFQCNLKELSIAYTSKVRSITKTQKGNQIIPSKKKPIIKTLLTWFEKLKSIFNSKVVRYIIYLGMTIIFRKDN